MKNKMTKMEEEGICDGEAWVLLNCVLHVWITEHHNKELGHLVMEAPGRMLKTKPAFSFLFIL